MNIKRGDKVKVITGVHKGKTGTVTKALPKENKVIVEGINLVSRHYKADRGGVTQIEAPIHVSNVKLTK